MGVAYFPVFETQLNGIDSNAFNGKALAKNAERLARASKRLEVAPLEAFCSVSDEEMDDLIGEEIAGEDPTWFAPADGLRTLEVLLQDVRRDPKSYDGIEALTADLEQLITLLNAAQKQGARFRMTIDI